MGFFGGGASVDLASPPAIGNTTPNTGAFTTLSANNGTITSDSTALSISQTWNNASTAFTAIKATITNTASASGSKFMSFLIGADEKIQIFKSNSIKFPNAYFGSMTVEFTTADIYTFAIWTHVGYSALIRQGRGILAAGFHIEGSGLLGWGDTISSGAYPNNSSDLFLTRDAANILAQRNSTNAQTFRLYRTFTDASNYERLGFIATRTTRFAIAAENAGTGAARSLEISFYTSASDPASTDITAGCFSVWKNSGTGTIKLWANDGGTMKSVALA